MNFPSHNTFSSQAKYPNPQPPNSLTRLDRRYALRSTLFFCSIVTITLVATVLMADFLDRSGWTTVKGFLLAAFIPLFGYATYGFCHAWFGFWTLRRRTRDPGLLVNGLPKSDVSLADTKTAIIMPIYHEDVLDVFNRIRANYLSLQETGELERFDFFILSDSQNPDIWAREELAWTQLCQELSGFGRIFYRRRTDNTGKKAGNVAEFCRSWGKRYDHMIVLDADSLLSGRTAVQMAQLMIANPRVGLIQTVPRLCNAETVFGRVQQFTMRFYGKIFLAGLNYWQQHNGNYWGHNAIIRMEPFMKYCDLPQLPGRKPFGGHILSHDFVEAALLRRAGWEVWLAPCLGESYEEGPPTLSESAARDRRWCGGNLQHTMLLFADRLKPASRVHLAGGIMGYLTAPLWLAFLLLSTVIAHQESLELPAEEEPSSLPGLATVSFETQGIAVLALTLLMLFLPKFLALADLCFDRDRARHFGGAHRTSASVMLESLFSALLAPILMLLHTRFVIEILTGLSTSWNPQKRSSEGIRWSDAFHQHKWHSLIGVCWSLTAWVIDPVFFLWLLPVLLGMLVSIPLAYVTSRRDLGLRLRKSRLFLTPEECKRPRILKLAAQKSTEQVPSQELPTLEQMGLWDLILDPYLSALHVGQLSTSPAPESQGRPPFDSIQQQRCQDLLQEGPERLTAEELNQLMACEDALRWLHVEIWRRPNSQLAAFWQQRLEDYHHLSSETSV